MAVKPLISRGLSYERKEGSGTKMKLEEFEMGGSLFNAVLTHFIDWGPLRGYERIEIFKNGRTLINYERGGMGHGSNYSKGSYFHLENKNAFLIKNGYAMRNAASDKIYLDLNGDNDYLFWFKNIVIPTKGKLWPMDGSALEHNKVYSLAEIEVLRQIEWEANVNFNNQNIYIRKSAVPYCLRTYWSCDEGYGEFQRIDQGGCTALDKIEFSDGFPLWRNPYHH